MKFYINRAKFVKETNKEIDSNNFLVAYDVPIAKTGIQQYTRKEIGDRGGDPDELLNVYRDRSVFNDQELIESFNGIPIVYDHPENGKVDNHNFKEFVVGTVSGVYFKDGDLFAKKLTIIDKEAIRNVLSKNTNELSIGFRGKVIKEKGKFEGVSYQYREDVIHANHLALCESGKAGSYYAINSKKGKNKMAGTYSTNSVAEDHEKMRDCMDSEVPTHNIEGMIEQAVRKQMSKVRPMNFDNDKEMENADEDMMDSDDEEDKEKMKEKGKEKMKAAMNDSTDPELEESEHKDKDVINSLKRSNRKLKDLLNSKNNEIRKLELQNIQLDETLTEATEYMRAMKNKLQSSNLVNSMAGPDNIASPTHPRQVDMCNSITSSFLYIK